MYIYAYTCIYTHTYIHIYMFIYSYIYKNMYTYTHIYTYVTCEKHYPILTRDSHIQNPQTKSKSLQHQNPQTKSLQHQNLQYVCVPYTKSALMSTMGWLRSVGSIQVRVSFAEYSLFYRALLQKRPMILRSLLIVATAYRRLLH